MKIAFCSTLLHVPWGGCEVLWVNAALYMKANGHEVSALVKEWREEPSHYKKLRAAGINLVFYTKEKKPTVAYKIRQKIIKTFFKKERNEFVFFEKRRPDYIFFSQAHTYDLGYFAESSIQSSLNLKIPFSVICQNNSEYSWVPEQNILERSRNIFKHAENIFFVSQRNLDSAVLHLCGLFPNFSVISNSLSIKAGEIEILPMPSFDEVSFACVANLKCSQKAQNLILHVFSGEGWKERKWKLNFYGRGQDEEYLKRLTAYLGMEGNVKFHGHVQDLKEVWKANHILLLASFDEGLPLALQEAMLLGRPAVVTDAGGNAELVTEGETGYLSLGTTKAGFGAALERAWQNKSSWENRGVNAYHYAKQKINLSPEKFLSDVAERSFAAAG